jgi:hypothetical protein
MRQNSFEISRWCKRRLVGLIVAAIGLIPLCSRPVRAHVISIGRGTVVVYPNRLTVELKVTAEDFVHYYGLGTSSKLPLTSEVLLQLAARHAHQLQEHLIIRESEGHQLSGRLISQTMDPALSENLDGERLRSLRVTYLFEYALASTPRHLSFQQAPGEGAAALPSQLYLEARPVGSDDLQVIRLTNGGNVETLKFEWPGDGGGRPSISRVDELQAVVACLDVHEVDVRVTLEIPLPMLETFLSIERADRDFLEVSEQMAAMPRLRAFFQGRNPIWINGQALNASDTKLEFLDIDSSGLDKSTHSTRLGAWMTRVTVIQSYKPNSRPDQIELHWNLFNAAVLEAEAIVVCNGRRSNHRISTYEPTLRWSRFAAESARAVKSAISIINGD